MSAIYFHWVGLNDIKRPAEDVQFKSISYQFFMLREEEMLARSHSCWCPACFSVATAGPGQGARLAPYAGYKVAGCTMARFLQVEKQELARQNGRQREQPGPARADARTCACGEPCTRGWPVGVVRSVRRRGGQALAGQALGFRWVQRAFPLLL